MFYCHTWDSTIKDGLKLKQVPCKFREAWGSQWAELNKSWHDRLKLKIMCDTTNREWRVRRNANLTNLFSSNTSKSSLWFCGHTCVGDKMTGEIRRRSSSGHVTHKADTETHTCKQTLCKQLPASKQFTTTLSEIKVLARTKWGSSAWTLFGFY